MSIPLRLLLVLLLASAVGSVWLVDAEREPSPVGWYCLEEVTGEKEWWCLGPNGRLAIFYLYHSHEDDADEPGAMIAMSGKWSTAGSSIRYSIDGPAVAFPPGYPETWWDPEGDRIESKLNGRTSWMEKASLPTWAAGVNADGFASSWSFDLDADPWWTRVP